MRIKRKSMRFGIRLPCRMREGAYSDCAVSAGKRLFFHGIIIRRNGDIGKQYLGVNYRYGRSHIVYAKKEKTCEKREVNCHDQARGYVIVS